MRGGMQELEHRAAMTVRVFKDYPDHVVREFTPFGAKSRENGEALRKKRRLLGVVARTPKPAARQGHCAVVVSQISAFPRSI